VSCLPRSLGDLPSHCHHSGLPTNLTLLSLCSDEHKDILEEMSRMRAARGKPDKVRGPKKEYPPKPWELT